MIFCKKSYCMLGGEKLRFVMFEYVLDLKDEYSWLISDYHMGLILESMTKPLIQVVFFFQFVCEKIWIFISVFAWKTNTWACKLLQLGLNGRDSDRTFHPDSLFLSIYLEKENHLYFSERHAFMTYKGLPLGPNTRDYDWIFHPSSIFL
jgi:hypothetical protein